MSDTGSSGVEEVFWLSNEMLVNLCAALAILLDYCIIDDYVLFGNKPVVSKLPTFY